MANRFTYETLIENWKNFIKQIKLDKEKGNWTAIKHNQYAIFTIYSNHRTDIEKFSKSEQIKARDLYNCANNIVRIIKKKYKDKEKQYEKQLKIMNQIICGRAKTR